MRRQLNEPAYGKTAGPGVGVDTTVENFRVTYLLPNGARNCELVISLAISGIGGASNGAIVCAYLGDDPGTDSVDSSLPPLLDLKGKLLVMQIVNAAGAGINPQRIPIKRIFQPGEYVTIEVTSSANLGSGTPDCTAFVTLVGDEPAGAYTLQA